MRHLQADAENHGQPQLQLFVRPSCLLCLEAEYLLASLGMDRYRRVDIERDPALEARYGERIPVLATHTGHELDWPFDRDMLARYLRLARSSS